MFQRALITLLLFCSTVVAQAPAVAAKGRVTLVRQVGLVTLVQVACQENKLTMELWLTPRVKTPWLVKDLAVNVVPTGGGQDVRVSPGRVARSDYTQPKPVRVLVSNGANKVTATIVNITFHQ